ncbi:MAG: hypothetical protein QNJ78_06070 [Gammaproteobacteria bacterium]|nr:hypothetical protein [Gammaproteobacteria bacterium]
MQVFEMIVAIVAISILGGLIKTYIKTKSENGDREGLLKQQVSDLKRSQLAMEKRIQVLETIVSSDGYDLKQRFKDLDQ